MISIGSIEYFNFQYIKSETVNFREEGVTAVIGENGQGKSTLFLDGPYYLLFGSSLRWENPGDKVIRRGQKSMYVKGDVDVNGTRYDIVRARGHDQYADGLTLYENGVDVTQGTTSATQDYLNQVLDITPLSWRTCCMFSADQVGMTRLPAGSRNEVLDTLLGISNIDEALEETKKALNEAEHDLALVQKDIESNTTSLDEAKEELENAQEESSKWDESVKASKKSIKADIDVKSEELQKLNEKIGKEFKSVAVRQLYLQGCIDHNDKVEGKITVLRNEFDGLRKRRIKILADAESIGEWVDKLSENKDGECPDCGAVVDENHIEHVVPGRVKMAEDKLNEADALMKQMNDIKDKIGKLNESKKEEVEVDKTALHDLELEATRTKTALEGLEEDLKELNDSNPHAERIDRLKKRVKEKQENALLLRESQRKASNRVADEKVLKSLFGSAGCRKTLVEQAIPFLNDSIQKTCELMETNLSISFDVGTRSALKIVIDKPGGTDDYEGGSGGERQRANVAVLLATIALVRSRGSKSFSQAWFDEAFERVDADGSAGIGAALRNLGGNVFVISHSSEPIEADRTWRVENGKLIAV